MAKSVSLQENLVKLVNAAKSIAQDESTEAMKKRQVLIHIYNELIKNATNGEPQFYPEVLDTMALFKVYARMETNSADVDRAARKMRENGSKVGDYRENESKIGDCR